MSAFILHVNAHIKVKHLNLCEFSLPTEGNEGLKSVNTPTDVMHGVTWSLLSCQIGLVVKDCCYLFYLFYLFIYFFPSKVWAASGVQRGSFGGKKEFILPKWAILGVTHLTPPTRKFAQVPSAYQHTHNHVFSTVTQ